MSDDIDTTDATDTTSLAAARDHLELRRITTTELASALEDAKLANGHVVALVPVGSVEPHGPHLPLGTDTSLGEESALRAASELRARGVLAFVAPAVPYGVTEYARGFAGAIGIEAPLLTALLRNLIERFVSDGFAHVCFVSNHLEPEHDAAVRAALEGVSPKEASVASPLTRRWGRTLSDEYKSGACHAGRYETSLALAAGESVRELAHALPELAISLSSGIRAGQKTFRDMGMTDAYTGAPALATRDEGDALYEKLVTMIVTEVEEALASAP